MHRLGNQNVNNRFLEAGGNIFQRQFLVIADLLFKLIYDGCFKTTEAEVQVSGFQQRPRELVSLAVTRTGQLINNRPSRKTDLKKFGNLVKSLACRIIKGGTQ